MKSDDLKQIEGVGPKINGLLQAAGITTFAALAAAGRTKEFEALRRQLRGGRRN